MKIQINAIYKMHDQIWTPQIKRNHTKNLHQQIDTLATSNKLS